jgi:hypothetical protein
LTAFIPLGETPGAGESRNVELFSVSNAWKTGGC